MVSSVAPLDLDLQLGAAEARLNVGGLAVSRMRVETGAADARLNFSEPNKTEMRRLDIQLGGRKHVTRQDVVQRLRPLLDLPIELVLPAHGEPTDRAALEHVLS